MKINRILKAFPSRGFTLIEMMVALGISLFMLLVIIKVFSSATDVTKTQDALSKLQERERLAMTVVKDVISSAGYFPNVTTNTRIGVFQATSPYPVGATLYGVDGASNSNPDTLRTRFDTAPNDGIMNCQGGSNTSGANQLYDNVITVITTNTNKHLLVCSLGINGAAPTPQQQQVPLIDGVTNIKFLYGIDSKGSGSVDQYVSASNVTNWTTVRSVVSTITFSNPLAGQPGQPATVSASYITHIMD